MLIGYVRVSTHDQNVDLQSTALVHAGCEKIFEDKVSGSTMDRPGLRKAIRSLNAGDSLLVWKLDRLGCSVKHLISLVGELQAKEAHFRSLTDNIDTGTAMGRFFFHVMSALAEMERELIVERTKAVLQAAREQGRIGGRRPVFSAEDFAQAGRLLANGYSRQLIANHYGIGISTMYRYFPASKPNDYPCHIANNTTHHSAT